MSRAKTTDVPQIVDGTVKLSEIRPSPTNPRKTFAEDSIRELADTISSMGLLQPLLVRPRGKINHQPFFNRGSSQWENVDWWEIIDGERRYRAMKLLKLKEVRVSVRNLTDREVLTVQLIANEQRADVLPTEQAAAYQRLLDAGGTVEEIATMIGRSTSVVRSTLLLARCPEKLAEAVDAGTVPRSTAELVCRVPNVVLRERVGECVRLGLDWYEPNTLRDPTVEINPDLWDKGSDPDAALTYRDTKELIQRCCMVELKSATFSRKSLDLVPAAGSCDACPKRAGNDPDLTADGVRADVCIDPECFREKTAVAGEQRAKAARECGRTVLTGEESEDLFRAGGSLKRDTYVDTAEVCPNDTAAKKRTYKKLVGKELESQIVVAFDHEGRPHDLIPREAARQALKSHGIKLNGESTNGNGNGKRAKSAAEIAESDKRRERQKQQKAFAAEVLRMAGTAGEMIFLGTLDEKETQGTKVVNQFLRQVAQELISKMWGERFEEFCNSLGIEAKSKADKVESINDRLTTSCGPQLTGIIGQCLAAHHLTTAWGYDDRAQPIADILGIKKEAVERRVAEAAARPVATKTRKTKRPKPSKYAFRLDERWRALPTADLELSPMLDATLELHGISTIGQLADALDAGEDVGLGEAQERVRALVDDAREGSGVAGGKREE